MERTLVIACILRKCTKAQLHQLLSVKFAKVVRFKTGVVFLLEGTSDGVIEVLIYGGDTFPSVYHLTPSELGLN